MLIRLLVLAICLRALVAPGLMPGEGVLLELCTADGLQKVLVDPESGEPLGDQHALDSDCPWSLAFNSAVLPGAAALRLTHRPTSPSRGVRVDRLLKQLTIELPPVRAPPES